MERPLDDRLPLETQRRQGFGSWFKNFSVVQFWKTLVNRVDNVLNAELMWKDFRSWVDDDQGLESQRYMRINPNLGFKPPRMDEKNEIERLSRTVQEQLKRKTGYHAKIRKVAYRLVASTFFFEKKELLPPHDGAYLCRGMHCSPVKSFLANVWIQGVYVADSPTEALSFVSLASFLIDLRTIIFSHSSVFTNDNRNM